MPDLVLRQPVTQAIMFIHIEYIIHKVLAYNDNIHIIIIKKANKLIYCNSDFCSYLK